MINIILLIISLVIVPLVIGSFMGEKSDIGKRTNLMLSYIWGNIILWAIFWFLCVPAAIFRIKLSSISLIFNIITIVLFLVALKQYGKKLYQTIRMLYIKLFKLDFMEWFIVALIVIQLLSSVFLKTAMDGDDATYVVTALDAVTNNEIATVRPYTGMPGAISLKLVLTSWNYFISYLSYISGVHVAVIAHTVLPLVLVPMAYMVFCLFGMTIFKRDRKKTVCFLLGMNLLILFGGYSVYTYTFRLLVCIWQGKAVMAVIVLPFLFYFLIKTETYGKKEILSILIIMIAACSMSLMGVGLSVLMLVIFLTANYKKKEWVKYKFLILPALVICGIAVFYLSKLSYWSRFSVEKIQELYPKAAAMLQGACTLYWDKSLMLFIYLLSLLYLVRKGKKDKHLDFLIKYTLIFYLIIFNPIFYYTAFVFCHGAAVYVRMFYVAFPEICMAVAFSQIVSDIKNERKRIGIIWWASILIVLAGEIYASIGYFEKADNFYKLPQETIELCDMINEDADKQPYLIADQGIINYIRQYSCEIKMLYGREGYYYNGEQIFDLIAKEEITEEEIWELMEQKGCNYLIWRNFSDDIVQFENCGAVVVGNTENYVVLRR